jgi:hypothetical protein
MSESPTLSAEVTRSLTSLWTRYAGKAPTNGRTEVTRQRVASFVSSHDRDTDVATEVFTLEPSLRRGAPAFGESRFGRASRLPPPRPPGALAETI